MRRRAVYIVLIPVILAALALALRQDLSSLALRTGEQRLGAGDVQGAWQAFQRAIALGVDAAPLRYNLGVTHYRNGQYAQARSQFDAAIARAGSGLLPAALYNRGNALFRQAERSAPHDPAAATRLFQAAIADYDKALALMPGAMDANANLGLARQRLAVLQGRAGADNVPPKGANQGQAAEKPAGQASRSGVTRPGRAEGKPKASNDPSASGRARKTLSQAEVERLLNDARGRDLPAGALHGGGDPGRQSRPDRDW